MANATMCSRGIAAISSADSTAATAADGTGRTAVRHAAEIAFATPPNVGCRKPAMMPLTIVTNFVLGVVF